MQNDTRLMRSVIPVIGLVMVAVAIALGGKGGGHVDCGDRGGSIGRRHHGNLQALGVRSALLPWRGFDPDAFRRLGADAVVIATATQVREEVIALCADLHLPFYVEKPLAFDPATLERILAVSAPLAKRCMVGFMMRYHPTMRLLAQTDLGTVYDASFGIGHDVRQWAQQLELRRKLRRPAAGGRGAAGPLPRA
jgi:predicted dehydrogenase